MNIQLSGGALRRVELVEQHAQHRDIGHVVEGYGIRVEIQVQVVDVAAGQVVRRHGSGHAASSTAAGSGFAAPMSEVPERGSVARASGESGVSCMARSSATSSRMACLAAHRDPQASGEFALFLAVVPRPRRASTSSNALWFDFTMSDSSTSSKIAAAKPLAHMGERVFVAQVRGRERVVVEPAGKRVHREHYAIGHAAVAFAQLKR